MIKCVIMIWADIAKRLSVSDISIDAAQLLLVILVLKLGIVAKMKDSLTVKNVRHTQTRAR